MTGVKDTFQNFFLDGIFASYKKATDKKAALEAKLATLPRDSTGAYDIDGMINPVWRIPGKSNCSPRDSGSDVFDS